MTQIRNDMPAGCDTVDRRRLLAGALAAAALPLMPRAALAESPAADPAREAVRHLMVLATKAALIRLGQPNGFLTSTVARFGLPVLFTKGGAAAVAPLSDRAFRELLIQRLNLIAEAGARGAVPAMAEASRKLPIVDAAAILHGRPTAATSALRLEMGSGLVNALRVPLEQALVAAQDPTIVQAVAALPGVTLGDVAHAIALSADNGIWYEIGAAEASIRADPAATGDGVLIAALSSRANAGPAAQPSL
ncbi:MAG: DUF4197 family protein [Novosphingobium sp.]